MANWELQLISDVVRGDDPRAAYDEVAAAGITFAHFSGLEARTIWAHIDAWYKRPNRFGHVPSEQSLLEEFPNMDLPRAVEPLADLCDKIREGFARRRVERALNDYMSSASSSVFESARLLKETLAEIEEQETRSNDRDWAECALEETIAAMDAAEENQGITGIPWPWARLNQATGGIQDGDYIMVWALPKSMKTWLGLFVASRLFELGHRVLVYSAEMKWPNVRTRINSIGARVDYGRLKAGELSSSERTAVLEFIERTSAEDFPGKLFFTDAKKADGSPGGPNEIRQKIEVYRPTFVMLDSCYMLELPGVSAVRAMDWQTILAMNRLLKRVAKDTGVPIMGIFQENERAALKYSGKSRGTASLAMATGAIQDCDLGIRVVKHAQRQELSLHLAAARETTVSGFTIHAVPGSNFEYAHDHLFEVGDDQGDEEDENVPGSGSDSGEEEVRQAETSFMSRLRSLNNANSTDEPSANAVS